LDGVEHIVWRITDPAFNEEVNRLLARQWLVIADGHHRYVTKQRGKEGLKEVVLEITAENGLEVQRKVVKERILKEPVTEVILVGGGLR
jgi:hypothetical protein